MEYYLVSNRQSLAHHGVIGMKWGVRRYQNKDGTRTELGKERYRNTKSGMSRFASMLDPSAKFPPSYEPDTLREVHGNLHEDGKFEWKNPLHEDLRVERLNADYLADPDSVFDTHMRKINRTHGEENGTLNNCTKTSATMCLAKMGYDYDAGRSMSGFGRAMEYWFDGEEHANYMNVATAVSDKFDKVANGSFGTVDLRNKNGGGHVFNWERNSKGEFSLYESQCKDGEKFSGSSPAECFDKYITKRPWFQAEGPVRVYDMTHASPNFAHMSEDSVVRITDDPNGKSVILDRNTNQVYENL